MDRATVWGQNVPAIDIPGCDLSLYSKGSDHKLAAKCCMHSEGGYVLVEYRTLFSLPYYN